MTHRQFFVSSRSGQDLTHDEENSQRTRSFLFLVLGSIAARRTGQHTLLYLAENGPNGHTPARRFRKNRCVFDPHCTSARTCHYDRSDERCSSNAAAN